MCGRFTLTASGEELAEAFDLDTAPSLAPRYNIAPSQPVLVVRATIDGRRRETASLSWGFEAPAGASTRLLINARAETAHRLPSFRDSFRARRCLIPASGFFEWQRSTRPRQPFYLYRRDGRPFALAGLWQPGPPGAERGACVILTTAPNVVVAPLHDRMPVILAPEDQAAWLAAEGPGPAARSRLFAPCPATSMAAHPVSAAVNDVRNDDASCLETAQTARTLFD